jgi:HlyD family secretion protein
VSGVAVVAAAAAGLYCWQVQRARALPADVVETDGRLEFARIDIAVKNPGRIVELSVHEGQHATAGEILAKQDDAELNAQLAGAARSAQRAQAR